MITWQHTASCTTVSKSTATINKRKYHRGSFCRTGQHRDRGLNILLLLCWCSSWLALKSLSTRQCYYHGALARRTRPAGLSLPPGIPCVSQRCASCTAAASAADKPLSAPSLLRQGTQRPPKGVASVVLVYRSKLENLFSLKRAT